LNPLKKLAGQTMIYGLGTIVPRVLNYLLLTPFFTYIFWQNEYGVFSELYAYVAIFLVVLTFGMETTYFRFAVSEPNKNKVFTTALGSVLSTSLLFFIVILLFADPVASLMSYPGQGNFIIWIAAIVATDAIVSIPFAKLRQENKAMKFAAIKFLSVVVNIALNAYFYYEKWSASDPHSVQISVEYIFIANFISSAFTLVCLLPEFVKMKPEFDFVLLKKMLSYTFPLLIVGASGMINEHGDKIMLKYLVDDSEDQLKQLGIYSANYRLAVLMTIFTQMFRYAAEPFFFAQSKEKDSKETYAKVLKYFVIFGLIIFLGVMLYIDIVKYFIGSLFHEGLDIVPVILLANLFFGIFYNLSLWYKLANLTKYGAVIAIIGAVVTILLNIVLVPEFGYRGAAWATIACYFLMTAISYFWGQKHFPVKYDFISIGFYFAVALGLYFGSTLIEIDSMTVSLIVNTLLFGVFFAVVFYKEKLYRYLKR